MAEGARITGFEKINLWNQEQLFEQRDSSEIVWDTFTTVNFVGFDIWLDDAESGRIVLDTNDVAETLDLKDIGLEDIVFQRSGLERKLRVFRMPEKNRVYELQDSLNVPLRPRGDNPLWVRVTTDDGYNAWSSPIFIYRQEE